jgi:beta-glucosidase
MLKVIKFNFPKNFLWGTATSALQIESGKDHDWVNLKARDGSILNKNIKHDSHRNEDAKIITSIGNAYRFSPDWSKLQKEPMGKLDKRTIEEYRDFMKILKKKNLHLMLVLHHFANPNWFVKTGAWENKRSIEIFRDYARKVALAFGDLTDSWNTLNEPGTYVGSGYIVGTFPPYKKLNCILAKTVIENMGEAHNAAYDEIRKISKKPIGISINTMDFCGESLFGKIYAKLINYIALEYIPNKFKKVDFIGLSYYGRIPFRPRSISTFNDPKATKRFNKLKKRHDKISEYYPRGLTKILVKFAKKYKKPIIVTENGYCTDNDMLRIQSIKDHIKAVHDAIRQGADVIGYFYWSTFDNFELHLGQSYRFGLVGVDLNTFKRKLKESAKFYTKLAKDNYLKIIHISE